MRATCRTEKKERRHFQETLNAQPHQQKHSTSNSSTNTKSQLQALAYISHQARRVRIAKCVCIARTEGMQLTTANHGCQSRARAGAMQPATTQPRNVRVNASELQTDEHHAAVSALMPRHLHSESTELYWRCARPSLWNRTRNLSPSTTDGPTLPLRLLITPVGLWPLPAS